MKVDRAQAATGVVIAGLVGATLCFMSGVASAEEPLKLPDSELEPINWTELAGWSGDDHLAAFAAYQASCQGLHKARKIYDQDPISSALWTVCHRGLGLHLQDSESARAFFEENFVPVRIRRVGEVDGFLTGYFEPIVPGSRFPNPEFHYPLYRRPHDLVAAGHKPGSETFGRDVGQGRILIRQKVSQADLAAMAGVARENVKPDAP